MSKTTKYEDTLEFREGYSARRGGKPLGSCPYFQSNTGDWDAWHAGYHKASIDVASENSRKKGSTDIILASSVTPSTLGYKPSCRGRIVLPKDTRIILLAWTPVSAPTHLDRLSRWLSAFTDPHRSYLIFGFNIESVQRMLLALSEKNPNIQMFLTPLPTIRLGRPLEDAVETLVNLTAAFNERTLVTPRPSNSESLPLEAQAILDVVARREPKDRFHIRYIS